MSDYEFDFDDDELYAWEDDILDTADDLAEHTMQSPVYADVDPKWDTSEYFSDWEYYSDDYYDYGGHDKQRKPLAAGHGTLDSGLKRKRQEVEDRGQKKRRLAEEQHSPAISSGRYGELSKNDLCLSEPIVWRKPPDVSRAPVLDAGRGEKVALLKDWRDKFKDRSLAVKQYPNFDKKSTFAKKGSGGPQDTQTPSEPTAQASTDHERSVLKSPKLGTKAGRGSNQYLSRKPGTATSSVGGLSTPLPNGNDTSTKRTMSATARSVNASLPKKPSGTGTKPNATDINADSPKPKAKQAASSQGAKDEGAHVPKTIGSGKARRS